MRNSMVSEICHYNYSSPALPFPPICEEPRTKVQLTVPLRENCAFKKPIFRPHARSWTRVHVWQLHVDILPAAYTELHGTGLGEKKNCKRSSLHRAPQVRRRTSVAVKSGIYAAIVSMTYSRLTSLSAFCFFSLFFFFPSSRLLAPRVGVQLVPSVYLYKVQYVLHNLVYIHHCESDSCSIHYTHTSCVLLHSALLELLSHRVAKCPDKVTQPWDLSAPSFFAIFLVKWYSISVFKVLSISIKLSQVDCNHMSEMFPIKIIITQSNSVEMRCNQMVTQM